MQTGAHPAAALPTIVDVHFADLSTPLIVSSLETPPPLLAEVPPTLVPLLFRAISMGYANEQRFGCDIRS
jgi:hypothetical protein